MPSVTPEHRRERRHRRERSSSNSSNSSGSNRSVKRTSEQSSSSSRKKSKDDKHQRNSSHRSKSDKRPKRGEHVEDSHQKPRRSHRSRSRSKSRERQSNRSSHSGSASRQKTTERDKERPKVDPTRVVIKQEPLSDDEDRRRRAPRRDTERVEVKVESDQTGNRSDVGDKKNVKEETKPKEKPNFQVSGKLAEDTNIFNGVVVKYNEPPEAKKPSKRWRLYAFKGEEALPMLPIHRQSAYLLGRDRKVADIPIDHPSCSKQHAVLQFRAVTYTRDDGTTGRRVRPYVIDLESANGTFVNNQKIDTKRYVELFEKDVVKFGFSSREYVLLHEGSTSDDIQDDDVKVEDEDKETEAAKEGDAETTPK